MQETLWVPIEKIIFPELETLMNLITIWKGILDTQYSKLDLERSELTSVMEDISQLTGMSSL